MNASLRTKLRPVSKASRAARGAKVKLQKRTDAAKVAWRKARQVLVAMKAKVRTSAAAYGKALSAAGVATDRLEAMGAPHYPTGSSADDETLLVELETVIQSQIDAVNASLGEFSP
jgi:uncharacterized membrane protein